MATSTSEAEESQIKSEQEKTRKQQRDWTENWARICELPCKIKVIRFEHKNAGSLEPAFLFTGGEGGNHESAKLFLLSQPLTATSLSAGVPQKWFISVVESSIHNADSRCQAPDGALNNLFLSQDASAEHAPVKPLKCWTLLCTKFTWLLLQACVRHASVQV